jgi:serpin B
LAAAASVFGSLAHGDPSSKPSPAGEQPPPLVLDLARSTDVLAQKVFPDSSGANSVYSPFSLGVGTAFVLKGARGAARLEMLRAMDQTKLANPSAAAHDLSAYLDRRAATSVGSAAVTIRVANLLALPKHVFVLSGYKKQVENAGGVILENADEASVDHWVEVQTKGMIHGPFQIDERAPTLINAIYFKGAWAKPFKKSKTRDLEFTLPDGNKILAPMMTREAFVDVAQGQNYRAISLPYQGGEFRIAIVLPKPGLTVQDARRELSANELN